MTSLQLRGVQRGAPMAALRAELHEGWMAPSVASMHSFPIPLLSALALGEKDMAVMGGGGSQDQTKDSHARFFALAHDQDCICPDPGCKRDAAVSRWISCDVSDM